MHKGAVELIIRRSGACQGSLPVAVHAARTVVATGPFTCAVPDCPLCALEFAYHAVRAVQEPLDQD